MNTAPSTGSTLRSFLDIRFNLLDFCDTGIINARFTRGEVLENLRRVGRRIGTSDGGMGMVRGDERLWLPGMVVGRSGIRLALLLVTFRRERLLLLHLLVPYED